MSKLVEYSEDAAIRSVKTAAQTAVALIGTTAVKITDVDWQGVLSAAVLAGIVSLLWSIVNLPTPLRSESVKAAKKLNPSGTSTEGNGDQTTVS